MTRKTPQDTSVTAPQEMATPPDLSQIPFAVPLPAPNPEHVTTASDLLSRHGDIDVLTGNVEMTFREYRLRADSVRFDTATKEVDAEGHVRLTGGDADEEINASHGTYNLRTETGRFYDVTGSVGLHRQPSIQRELEPMVLQNSNPLLFSGRVVEKTGPEQYTIYNGTVTSCQLPRPDWLFSARRFSVKDGTVRSGNATFRLIGVPLLFFPFLTAPMQARQRQSGFLIPELPSESTTKGLTFGEQVYFVLGRSADLTLGSVYYSQRGFSESGTFRYRGQALDFVAAHFSALQDRGYTPTGGTYTNQGGEDLTAAIRKQFSPNVRFVGDGEYLSSYVYREAFTSNFNQAVSSDINSIAYITRQTEGWSIDARADRYQGLKQVPIDTAPEEEVHILHVPSVDLDGVEHPLPGTPFHWTLDASAAGLKRAQPDFTSSGVVERVDLRPELSLPLHFDGWNLRAGIAARETFYSRSRQTPYVAGAAPVELTTPINRADLEMEVSLRPPVLERTFMVPAKLSNLFGTEVTHTIEPELTYRNVRGVDNFLNILRFDDVDLASDTDELEYGATQHLYFRPAPRPSPKLPAGCPTTPTPQKASAASGNATRPAAATGADGSEMTSEGAQAPGEDQQVPDVLTPTVADSTDANGIPSPAATAPDAPLQTRPRHLSRCVPVPVAAQQPLLSWRLAQRVFFDPTFGSAVITNRRNIFESTLSLSGIAFLTEPRDISPLISRLRVRTSGHTDLEWDFDLDTGAKKFTSSNVFLDAHEGSWFGGISYARLNAPGRFAKEIIDTDQTTTLATSPISNFSQLRVLLGYGLPSRPGLSVAGNLGLDLIAGSLQYATLQASYNWNCCGLAVEYRKYDLGTVRDENSYRFNFTLANIGTAGNIRRAERLF